jgi:heme exporter protein C
VSRLARPALHADFLYPLLIMGAAFLVLFLAITLTRMQMEVLRQRLRVRARAGASENA